MDKMRPAITLFITLAVIAAMLVLVGVIFSYLGEARSKAEDKVALIEANLLYADVIKAVDKYVGKKPSVGTLKNIYDIPLSVREKKGPFNVLAACTPAHAAVPITWLATNGGAKRESQNSMANLVFDDMALEYRLKDANSLKELLVDALNSKEVLNFGETARLQRQSHYFSWRDFRKVLDAYAIKEDDNSVYNVNWNYYFAFGREFKEIDGNFLSSKLISIIFGIDEQVVAEDFKSGHLKAFLEENGADVELYKTPLFAKGAVVALQCSVNYSFGKGSYSFKFNYIDGKVESFEFLQ
jgi:hypothetical protein